MAASVNSVVRCRAVAPNKKNKSGFPTRLEKCATAQELQRTLRAKQTARTMRNITREPSNVFVLLVH